MAKALLGELLLQNGEITQEQLNEALKIQEKEGGLIGIILKRLGHVDEAKLIEYLTLQATQRVTEGKKLAKEEDN
jgi:type IV pilus assembly protein PilB